MWLDQKFCIPLSRTPRRRMYAALTSSMMGLELAQGSLLHPLIVQPIIDYPFRNFDTPSNFFAIP